MEKNFDFSFLLDRHEGAASKTITLKMWEYLKFLNKPGLPEIEKNLD